MKANTSIAIAMTSLLTAAIALNGCATGGTGKVYEKDGRKYGVVSGSFRDRWWNYYERGDSYLEGGYTQDAADDFAAAISRRDVDGRRARTYGMHFTDYFPHRELGIAYLGLGRPEDAVRELELSMSQEETAKAKFYLNKARKEILSKDQASLPGPKLTVNWPHEVLTNAFEFQLKGSASSEGYVSSVSINDRAVLVELASKDLSFDRTIQLSEGDNKVTVKASDLLGKTAEETLVAHVDRRGPVIELDSPDPSELVAGGRALVKGTAYDPSGITAVRINGREVAAGKATEVEFSEEVTVEAGRPIELTAADGAGNVTTAKVEYGMPGPDTASLTDGPDIRTMYASLDEYMVMAKAKATAADPPKISLKDLADSQEVFYDTIFIEGSVSAGGNVIGLSINGEDIISRKGKKLFFNYLLSLKEGENRVTMKATDAGGRTVERVVLITRKPQQARSLGSRLTVSALPFLAEGKAGAGGLGYDAFINAIVEQKRFNLVERTMLEEVLQEQALSQEKIADPSTAARLGKLVSAEGVIVSSLHETDRSVEVFTRLIDTETSEVIESQDVYGEDKSMKGVTDLMEGLAVKLKNSYPMLEGLVLKMDGDTVLVDIGSHQGVRKNMTIILFREGAHIIHPVTGKDLGAPSELLGKARVNEVYDDMAKAEVVRAEGRDGVKPMDMVITK